jgi:hypothetical protein
LKKVHIEVEGEENLKVMVDGNVTLRRDPQRGRRLERRVPHRIV